VHAAFRRRVLHNDCANAIRDIGRGDPIMQMVLFVWGVSILISLFGIWLVRRAPPRRLEMSVPSAPGSPRPQRRLHPLLAILLVLIGIVLLLPGLCSLALIVLYVRDLDGLAPMVVLWLITFAVAAGGVALIRYAVRGGRAAG
jgi:hypothetical protein